jgi:LPS export ABC transporter protein LptC
MGQLFIHVLLLWLLLYLVTGCREKETANILPAPKEEDPMMSALAIDVLFSDSGRIEARLTSPSMKKYTGELARMEFQKGFHVILYDSVMREQSTISANYGIRLEMSRIMEARGNVVVRNELKNEQLNTEQLIWDQPRRTIYSKKKVRITTPGKILFGDGIESDEAFSKYRITNPTGQMVVKKDSV